MKNWFLLSMTVAMSVLAVALYRQHDEAGRLKSERDNLRGVVAKLTAEIGQAGATGKEHSDKTALPASASASPVLSWVCSNYYSIRTCLAYDLDGIEFGEVSIDAGRSARAYITTKAGRYQRMDTVSIDRGKRWLQAKFEESLEGATR